MSEANSGNTQYSSTAKWLHWVMGIVIIFDLLVAGTIEDMPLDEKAQTLIIHSSIGLTLFVLVLVRLVWRHRNKAPGLPEDMPSWQQTASKVSHFTLYALMVIVPLTGVYISQFSPVTVRPFGQFELGGAGNSAEAFESIHVIHALATTLLFVLVCIHILAAIYHRFIRKDDILQRMAPRFRGKQG